MSEERNKTIDTMKIVATIMVVYVHSHNIIGYSGIEYEGRIIAFFRYWQMQGFLSSS